MSCPWMCLSLLCAATCCLQSSASSGEAVSLKCNDTVEVGAGESVTLSCDVHHEIPNQDCKVLDVWCEISPKTSRECVLERTNNTQGNQADVSVTISNVTDGDGWIIRVWTDCGYAQSSTIKVQRKKTPSHGPVLFGNKEPVQSLEQHRMVHYILVVFLVLLVGALLVLFRTDRGRKILKSKTRERKESETLCLPDEC